VLISATMAGHLPDGAPKPLTVPHGLADRTSSDHKPPALVDGIRSAYLGNMAIPYLDRSSLLRAVRAHPEMTLYLLGPYGGNLGDRPMDPIWEAILKEPNVIWTGAIPSEHVHAWLSAMDLLIIAYDSARYLNETAHPHKVMEYLASGRPVLATYMRDMAHLDHLIEMLPPGVPIDHALGKVLNDLEQLGTLELFNARRTYALANTYAKHTTTILEHIDHLTDRP
jgi:Glycosyl transferases group 1